MADDKFFKGFVTARKDFSPELWSLRVRPEVDFPFTPGQYATLGVYVDGRLIERPYSIVSAPHEPELEFFIELVENGDLTPRLYRLPPGAELQVRRRAKGRFTLDRKGGRPKHLMVATVTGIAPYCSMARSLYRDWKEGKYPEGLQLFVLQGASRSLEMGYREEMERIASEVPWFRYVPTISRPWEDQDWKGELGRVEDILRKYADNFGLTPADTMAYLCGHPQMIVNAKGILLRSGFHQENLREEQYWVQQ